LDSKCGLLHGPIPANSVHLCLDMQNLFSEGAPWATPWMKRVLPAISEISERHAERTIFTRFIPPHRAEDMPGLWKDFYRSWPQITGEHLDPVYLELVPQLARLVPPATVLDKQRYSPFHGTNLVAHLQQKSVSTVIFTGAETDVCVLSAVLDAVDIGLRVIIISDGICSSTDDTHDALVQLYRRRFSHQIEIVDAETVLRNWDLA